MQYAWLAFFCFYTGISWHQRVAAYLVSQTRHRLSSLGVGSYSRLAGGLVHLCLKQIPRTNNLNCLT